MPEADTDESECSKKADFVYRCKLPSFPNCGVADRDSEQNWFARLAEESQRNFLLDRYAYY